MNREPVMTAGTIAGLVAGIIALLVAFNVPVTPEQQKSILDFIPAAFAFAAPVVAAWVARNQVTPLSDPRDEDGDRLLPIAAVKSADGSNVTESELGSYLEDR